MELASERSGEGASLLQKEKRSKNSVGDDDDAHHKQEIVVEEPPVANTEKSMPEARPSASSSQKDQKVDDELETTKAEMGVVREENERLKVSLNKIMNEYRTLEMKFQDMLKQGTRKNADKGNEKHEEILEEPDDLVSLSLGRVPSIPKNDEKMKACKSLKDEEGDLSLGLECKFETSKSEANLPNPSPENSCEVPKEEAGETLKTIMIGDTEDELAQQNPAKKPRVCVRARCDTPTMHDGCQWRKYGQKIAKGNPCPRAYYRCTITASCPVRKQVQRCAEDMSILMTTYEGRHNHSLPASATGMASTTSAAASMLLSGSSTSTSGTALSSSPSHPTITLDLTSHPAPPSPFLRYPSSSSSSTQPHALNFGRQQLQTVYQSYMQNMNNTTLSQVITTDPTFQSALATALTSFIGNQGVFPPSNSSSHTKSFMFLPPSATSLPFSTASPHNTHATD